MQRNGKIAHGIDELYWSEAWQTLAVRRAFPLWSAAGVLEPFVREPDALVDVARHFLKQTWKGVPVERFEEELGHAFRAVTQAYGDESTAQLLSWMRRNFVDQEELNMWDRLALVLPAMFRDGTVPPDIEISREAVDCLRRAVIERFNEAVSEELDAVVEGAYSIPLSPEERELLAFEVDEPDVLREADPVLSLDVRLGPQGAYEVWSECVEPMSSSDKSALLQWAREVGPSVGIRPEVLNLPPLHG